MDSSQQKVAEASNFANETVGDIRKDLSEGSLSIRVVTIVTSLVMVVTGLLGFVMNFLTLHWIAAVLKIYVFATGIVVLVLESSHRLSVFSPTETKLYETLPFLR